MIGHTDAWLLPPDIHAICDRACRYRDEVYTATGHMPDRFLVTEVEYSLLQMYHAHAPVAPHHHPSVRDEIQLMGMRVYKPERMEWSSGNSSMDHFRISSILHRSLSRWAPVPWSPAQPEHCRTARPLRRQRDIVCPCGEVIWDLSTCTWDAEPATLWGIPIRSDPTLTPEECRMVSFHHPIVDAFDRGLIRIMARMEQQLTTSLGVPEAVLGRDHGSVRDRRRDRLDQVMAEQIARRRMDANERVVRSIIGRGLLTSGRAPTAANGERMETPDSVLPDETLTCCGQEWPTHADWMEHYREAHG
jgi:hypothetical protein